MAEYYVRKVTDISYEVAKFAGRAEPETVYVVAKLSKLLGKLKCECQGFQFRGACKHVPMVAQFINQGEKMPFHVKEPT